jgi:hypothetical protein
MQIQSYSMRLSSSHTESSQLTVQAMVTSAAAATRATALAGPDHGADDHDTVHWSDRVRQGEGHHRAEGHRRHEGGGRADRSERAERGERSERGERRSEHGVAHGRRCGPGDREMAVDEAGDAQRSADPIVGMLRQVIEWLTGRPVETVKDSDLQAPAAAAGTTAAGTTAAGTTAAGTTAAGTTAAGAATSYARPSGSHLQVHASYAETEQLSFQAEGTVHTTDGQTVNFSISLQMQRSYSATIDLSIGSRTAPAPRDPLVVNFGGNAAQLSDQTFAFDLNQDGAPESLRLPGAGSGLLVFDKNGNGQLDNAGELFGPGSGDGFSDLAALDSDGNGWVDSGDDAFSRLGVMSAADAAGAKVRSLSSLGIGALGTSHIDTPFSLKDSGNALQGQIRATGVYLTESGQAGTVQQLDVVV